MANPFVKGWKYLMALFDNKIEENADPKVQIEQAIEEAQEGARPFRELEAQDALVREADGAPADHVADVQLGRFIVAHVHHAVAVGGETFEQAFALGGGEDRTAGHAVSFFLKT